MSFILIHYIDQGSSDAFVRDFDTDGKYVGETVDFSDLSGQQKGYALEEVVAPKFLEQEMGYKFIEVVDAYPQHVDPGLDDFVGGGE